ncbi:hypothetical protein IscW_ISCW015029 [Ixodes scapularis]|uniref:Uncharacterized protein n=1 Tax=Ixodes scapularis TaxID=6945 RepID=B7QL16_IXOSC|nr:hypothetical protein IscW_ISCW015029 [Ixodes scapularis]|eukprot:XP_002415871.1 hypothetical protein IscW_ISCW015029 [Ixodes scapularis]
MRTTTLIAVCLVLSLAVIPQRARAVNWGDMVVDVAEDILKTIEDMTTDITDTIGHAIDTIFGGSSSGNSTPGNAPAT